MSLVVLLLLLLALACGGSALNNGVGRTPAMGWNTWCTESFFCSTDYCTEAEVESMADSMSLPLWMCAEIAISFVLRY